MIKAIVFLLLLSATAMADMPCAQFGGWYVGANIGWTHDDYQFDDLGGFHGRLDDGLPGNVRIENDGVLGGVQIGYNWQPCCSLLGIEADFDATSLRSSAKAFDGDSPTQDTVTITNRVHFMGTVRGRAGVVVDRLLLYGTAGFAYAHTKQSWSFSDDLPITTETFTRNHMRVGGVGGIGAEWAISRCLSAKAEFLYVQFKQDRKRVTSEVFLPGSNFLFQTHESQTIARIGINYRWCRC